MNAARSLQCLVAAALILALRPLAAAGQTAPDPVGGLGWLAGCWTMEQGSRSTLEMWMPPAGGLMIGGSRTVANGVTREFEQLRLQSRAGMLVYVASPSGQQTTEFTGSATESGFVVENPAHDFPKAIGYRRAGTDSLVAWIEGPGRDGRPRRIEFPYRRASCTGS